MFNLCLWQRFIQEIAIDDRLEMRPVTDERAGQHHEDEEQPITTVRPSNRPTVELEAVQG